MLRRCLLVACLCALGDVLEGTGGENQRRTRGEPEENQRRTGGEPEENQRRTIRLTQAFWREKNRQIINATVVVLTTSVALPPLREVRGASPGKGGGA